MKLFQQIISYLFHPLFIPVAGTFAYFLITPKYNTIETQSGNVLPVFILTVIVPIIAYLILHNIGVVKSVLAPTVSERKYPLYTIILLLFMVVYKVIPNNFTIELHYFFLGLIAACMAALLLLFLNFKSSIHLMGMGSLLMYLICLSVHFEINITIALSVLLLCTGLVASSRLYLRSYSKAEILIGFFIGAISQLLTVKFWL